MLSIVITIRRRGVPACRQLGNFASTADAIVNLLTIEGDALAGARISAQVL